MRRFVLATLISAVALCAADPFTGTWKFNPAKSKSVRPLAKSATMTIKASDEGQTVSREGVSADGKPLKMSFTAKFDGRDYPVSGLTNADATTLRRINSRTVESTAKNGGRIVSTARVTVSPDGKTLTIETQRAAQDGEAGRSVTVWERQ